MRPPARPLARWCRGAWTALGMAGLIAFGWAEPWSAKALAGLAARGWPAPLVDWVLTPLVFGARAVLIVEASGYLYHRFFQHLGRLTRVARVFRRNQMYHWMHHMVLYPIGSCYKRPVGYVDSEPGIAWSWVAPALLALAAALLTHGLTAGGAAFAAAIALYAKLVVDRTHSRFHETDHPWAGSRYFQWLEEVHILHHWDQRRNFAIVLPLMDWLFGTYMRPARHRQELKLALTDSELSASDLINWRYLLIEATPAEHAAFISQARRHPRSLRKLARLLGLLTARTDRYPNDALARKLLDRAEKLWDLVKPREAAA